MASSNSQTEAPAPSVPKNPAMASCRKKKTDDATFIEDLKDHIDEFIHASMDEHKTCFKKTIQKVSCTIILKFVFCFGLSAVMHLVLKISCFLWIAQMFGMSKAVAERSAAEAKDAEVESALPLQTSVSQ